jgi:PadR family transcriptional regulator
MENGKMDKPVRMTYATSMVLQALDCGYKHGFDIIEATGLRSGTVYPLLRRFEASKLVRSKWEPVSVARANNRPPRKYYELTSQAEPIVLEATRRFPSLEALPETPTARQTR